MPLKLVSRLVDKMGNASLRSRPRSHHRHNRENVNDEDNTTNWFNGESYDNEFNEELRIMKRLIKDKPDAFVLNNVILALHLFSNYKQEIEEAWTKLESNEKKMNEKFLPNKSVLLPDVLREHFADRIRFTAHSSSDRDDVTVEPIRPIRIYMKYENVLVSEIDDVQHYFNPDELAIEYNFVLKETGRKGYARLQQRETSTTSDIVKNPSSDNTDPSSTEIYNDDGSVYGPVVASPSGKSLTRSVSKSLPDLLDEDEDDDDDNTDYYNRRNKATSNGRSRIARSSRINGRNTTSSTRSTIQDSDSDSSSLSSTYTRDSTSSASSSSFTRSLARRMMKKKQHQFAGCDVPSDCMKTVTFMYDGRIYDPRRESKVALTRQKRRIRAAIIAKNKKVVYVNGYRLAKHFYNGFKAQLGQLLDFDEQTVRSAKRCDSAIRLETIEHLSPKDQRAYVKIEPYEVIPCFASPWPKWARGWLERPRAGWPAYEDLLRAEKFGCCLVPESSKPPSINGNLGNSNNNSNDNDHTTNHTNDHPLWKLDWGLSFPAAERYLETCLSASQSIVFSVALILHKTFIRALGPSFGLEAGHIRNMLFLMAEKNPEWSELQMGQWTLQLLESLHSRIQQRSMPDYFMHERNLFATVSSDDLLHAQKQLQRIIDNPVMFVLHAIERVQYENTGESDLCRSNSCLCCSPRLDQAGLLKILLTRHELVLRNANLAPQQQQYSNNGSESYAASDAGSSTSTYSTYGGYTRRETEKDFWTEAKQQQHHRRRSDRIIITPKRELDSVIDILERCEPLTPIRLSLLVEFFAEHSIRMARYCNDRGAGRSKRAHLNQAKLLASLLAEDSDYEESARNLLQQVKELREKPMKQRPAVPPKPEIPVRNNATADADSPIMRSRLKRQVSYADAVGKVDEE